MNGRLTIPKTRNTSIYLLISVFLIALFTLAYLKYRSYNTLMDLPIYYQAMWSTLRGRLMFTTTYLPQGYNVLGDHWNLIMLLFLPFFRLFQTPVSLLFIQSFFLTIGALPIYKIGREKFNNSIALAFATAYLLHPTIWYSNLNDFHLTSIAAALVSFCFYYCYKKEYRKFLFFLALLLNSQEDMILLGITFGVYIVLVNKDKAIGGLVALGSLSWFVIVIKMLIPYFGANVFESSAHYLTVRYSYLGSNFSEVLHTVFLRPDVVIKNVVTIPKIAYLGSIFLPTAFLALLSPEVLFIILPIFSENLLSTYLWQYLPTTQYTTAAIPLLYIAAIFGTEKLKINAGRMGAIVLFISILSNLVYGPPPIGIVWKLDLGIESSYSGISFFKSGHDVAADEIIKGIPSEVSVAASSNLVSHISMREKLYQMQFVNTSFLESHADYVLFDTESYFFGKYSHEQILLEELLHSQNYTVIENKSGLILLRK